MDKSIIEQIEKEAAKEYPYSDKHDINHHIDGSRMVFINNANFGYQLRDKEVEELTNQVKALSAIKKGLETSLFKALKKSYMSQLECSRYNAQCNLEIAEKEVEVLTDELLKTAEKYGCASKQLQQKDKEVEELKEQIKDLEKLLRQAYERIPNY